jgi:hypothetical protein
MSAEANCPKCGAELVDDRSADPDQFYMRRWACGGMEVRRLTGPAFYNDGAPYCLKAEVEQKSAQLSALTARVAELEGERERLRRAFVEMENHTDGHSWYWLSYGEKCYAFAVAAAFPFNEQDEYPPAGTYLTPHETDEQLWVAENGVEMMTDESIASIERQNGDVICKFIAQAYAFAAALAPPEPQPRKEGK